MSAFLAYPIQNFFLHQFAHACSVLCLWVLDQNKKCWDWAKGMLSRPFQYLSGLRPVARSLQFSFSGHFVSCCHIWHHQGHHCSFGGFRFFSIKRDVTYLLVDADSVGKDLVDQAKSFLRDEHLEVLVFGNPQLCRAKSWSGFFNAPEHKFHAVDRVSGFSDPNDDAIKQDAERLVKLPQTKGFGLLSSDKDFVELAKMVQSFRKEMRVFLVRHRSGRRKAFEEAGATVFLLGSAGRAVGGVRAILNSDGSGWTELAEDQPDPESMALAADISDTLCGLGYRSHHKHPLVPALAKFWFRHDLGPLVVYPTDYALRSVHKVLSGQKQFKALTSDKDGLAFVLAVSGPMQTKRTMSVADTQLYGGSGKAKRIYAGGGPFILRQSNCLTMNVLRRLGYLDDCTNLDLNEALLVFLNLTDNKRNLRKAGMLPDIKDSHHEIQRKINQALLSEQTHGNWSLAPRDMEVRYQLVAAGLLHKAEQPREEVLTAMQEYTRRHGLRAMNSYNGYVWQLKQRHNASDPSRRDEVKPSCLLK